MAKCKRLVIITAVIIDLTIVCSRIVCSSTKEYRIKSTFEYTAKTGDTLSSIAEKYKPKDGKTQNGFVSMSPMHMLEKYKSTEELKNVKIIRLLLKIIQMFRKGLNY